MAEGHAERIIDAFKREWPRELTQSDVAAIVGLQRHQVNKRLADLCNKGIIEPTGETRLGDARRQERVWRMVR